MKRTVVYTGDIFRLQSLGGISRYFLELFRRLDRPSEVVAGWHRSRELDLASRNRTSQARVTASRLAPAFPGGARAYALANARADARALRSVQDRIVHPTYYRDPRSLPRNAPVIATVFDMAHERHPEHFRRRWWSAPDAARHKRALCERADAIVCISEATRADLVAILGVPRNKTRVIHLAAHDWRLVPAANVASDGRPFFLWVGERAGYKNFLPTLAAWAACAEARETKLLCVGGGPLRAAERAAAERLQVGPRLAQVNLLDTELRGLYENARGLLYTSLSEGFGLPVIEAMSLGCRVVASDRPVIREVAADFAILVDPESQEAMRAGIARCLSQGRDAASSEASRAHARRFSWDACAAAHEALYHEFDR